MPLLKKPATARPHSGNAAAFLQQPGPIKPILQAWQQGMG
ncbi:MAG: hypothetical protein RLZZ584_2070, partial [Pseudomonadota bacterium]